MHILHTGPLTRAGVFVFFTSFSTLPELNGIPPEVIIPATREADITDILLAAHTRLGLEQDDEAFDDDDLEPPPLDLNALDIEEDDEDNSTISATRFARHVYKRSRVRRVAENIQPVECSEYQLLMDIISCMTT